MRALGFLGLREKVGMKVMVTEDEETRLKIYKRGKKLL